MNERLVERILRADALVDLVAGVLLLSATWDDLLDTLDLPQAHPALLVQLGGALSLGFAYLLWVAPTDATLTRHVSLGAAIANGIAAPMILAWLVFSDPRVGTQGTIELAAVSALLAFFALAQARMAAAPVVVRPVEPGA